MDTINKNVVVIPCFDRPEFLFHCLENIKKADKAKDNYYIFAVDHGYDPDVLAVIEQFPYEKFCIAQNKEYFVKPATKQSYNVLYALLAASEITKKYIWLIEDDIMIGRDFFTFSIDVMKKEKDVFASIMSRNHNTKKDFVVNELNAYYIGENADYQSWGVCFDKAIFNKYVKPHITTSYFSSPHYYLSMYLHNTPIGSDFIEQDGLIRRILFKSGLRCAFPVTPRCFHSGFYSYHRFNDRGSYMKLSLSERIKVIGDLIYDKAEMAALNAGNEHFIYDSEPTDLNTSHTELNKL